MKPNFDELEKDSYFKERFDSFYRDFYASEEGHAMLIQLSTGADEDSVRTFLYGIYLLGCGDAMIKIGQEIAVTVIYPDDLLIKH